MIDTVKILNGYSTAEARWARFGPYYAMFPIDFAFQIVEKYSKPGDFIIDPFAGRCSSIYAGSVLGRNSLGIEINPVGWLYGKVKLSPATEEGVKDRLLELYSKRNHFSRSAQAMPIFYRMCYCEEVLKLLLCCRTHLDWENNDVDATLMSILLVYLHGKLGEGLSNQMRMTKAMGINYSVDWWQRNNMTAPPEIDPIKFLYKKIEWRYKKGIPKVTEGDVLFGDSTLHLKDIVLGAQLCDIKFSLLFTSPPYCAITDYHTDQWLRLWLLGGPEIPQSNNEKHKGRFSSKTEYFDLLDSVFGQCSKIMEEKSTVYVRTDIRKYTFNTTKEILQSHFPKHRLRTKKDEHSARTQTEIMGNKSNETGEIDIILTRR